MTTAAIALPVAWRSRVVLGVASLAGVMMFLWPLFVTPSGQAHATDAPYLFALILPLLLAVVFAELSTGGIDAKALALIGVLAGVGSALRPIGAGTAGIEMVFFLLILAGRVFGPGFGFLLGTTTLFASALLTAGVGPWLPFQMLGAGWVGLGAGLLPRMSGRREIALLALYGAVAAFAFGFAMNMWFWPYAAGTTYSATDAGLQFVPGAPVIDNLRRFFWFTLATSTLGWDAGRAITNIVLVVTLGHPILGVLRRAHRRAAFAAPVEFAPSLQPGGERAR